MKTILIAEFKLEANRRSPFLSDLTAYKNRKAYIGKEDVMKYFAGAKTEMTGLMDYFSKKDDYCLLPVLSFECQPGGPTSDEVFDLVYKKLSEAINNDHIDGILLSLHGAMTTESFEDGEGELLSRLRILVGKDVPIMTTLDLHANMTEKMFENADAFFPCDYYPHTDYYETGLRAAECMFLTLEGKIKPCMRHKKLDFLMPYIPTEFAPMKELVDMTRSLRNNGKIISVNICHGFFASDIFEAGSTVICITDSDSELAQDTADKIGEMLFSKRYELKKEYYSAEDGVRKALSCTEFPVALGDVADNSGAGATADSTELLREMIKQNMTDAAFSGFYDPETVKEAIKVGVGNIGDFELGGKFAPEVTGGPYKCKAKVINITNGIYRNCGTYANGLEMNFGPTALLKINGVYVIVSSKRLQPVDFGQYISVGLEPEKLKYLAIKSSLHFRAGFKDKVKAFIDIETKSIAPQSPNAFLYERVRRPIYPLDEM